MTLEIVTLCRTLILANISGEKWGFPSIFTSYRNLKISQSGFLIIS